MSPISYPSSFTAAEKLLDRARNCWEGRPLGANTRLIKRTDNKIAVRYHQTDIVTFYRNGTIEVSNGGWWTVTTKEKINACLHNRVHGATDNCRRVDPVDCWFVGGGELDETHVMFGTSFTLRPGRRPLGLIPLSVVHKRNAVKRAKEAAQKKRAQLRLTGLRKRLHAIVKCLERSDNLDVIPVHPSQKRMQDLALKNIEFLQAQLAEHKDLLEKEEIKSSNRWRRLKESRERIVQLRRQLGFGKTKPRKYKRVIEIDAHGTDTLVEQDAL